MRTRAFTASACLTAPRKPHKRPFGYSEPDSTRRSEENELSKKVERLSRRLETTMAVTERQLQAAKAVKDNAAIRRLQYRIKGHWINFEGVAIASRICYALDELPDQLLRDPVPYSAPQLIRDFYTGFFRLWITELKALLHTSLAPPGLVSLGQRVLGVFRFACRALVGLPITPLVLSTILMRPIVESQCRAGKSEKEKKKDKQSRD